MQDSHLVHEEDPVTDLPDEHHGIHFSQLVVLVHDPLKELAALDAVCTDPPARPALGCWPCRPAPAPTSGTHYSMNRMISCEVSMAEYSWIRLRWFSWFMTSISNITISWGAGKSRGPTGHQHPHPPDSSLLVFLPLPLSPYNLTLSICIKSLTMLYPGGISSQSHVWWHMLVIPEFRGRGRRVKSSRLAWITQ